MTVPVPALPTRRRAPRAAMLLVAALLPLAAPTAAAPADDALAAAVASGHRTPAFVARDVWRHPLETLTFFGVRPQQVVVEIWPGGAGWYAEILAPYLQAQGRYIAATHPHDSDYGRRELERLNAKFGERPDHYGRVERAEFQPPARLPVAPGTADVVLTFRNVHNWIDGGFEAEAFAAFFAMLKPGGVLGVVEHRAAPGSDRAVAADTGYVSEGYVRSLAFAAGFEFAGASEINANPRDTRNHPKGVWTLPPVLALKDVDREKYLAIGESDRMTLKFVKPAAPAAADSTAPAAQSSGS